MRSWHQWFSTDPAREPANSGRHPRAAAFTRPVAPAARSPPKRQICVGDPRAGPDDPARAGLDQHDTIRREDVSSTAPHDEHGKPHPCSSPRPQTSQSASKSSVSATCAPPRGSCAATREDRGLDVRSEQRSNGIVAANPRTVRSWTARIAHCTYSVTPMRTLGTRTLRTPSMKAGPGPCVPWHLLVELSRR